MINADGERKNRHKISECKRVKKARKINKGIETIEEVGSKERNEDIEIEG